MTECVYLSKKITYLYPNVGTYIQVHMVTAIKEIVPFFFYQLVVKQLESL